MDKVLGFDDPNVFIEKLINIGVNSQASDIHITPGKEQIYIRFRISGKLNNFYSIGYDHYEKLLNTIKVASSMAIDEHRHIQDGKMFFNILLKSGEEVGVNIRVSVIPTIYAENIVLRILLSNSKYLNIDNLGFSESNKAIIDEIKDMKEGLVLLCGGTGSGKTTTLYSLLSRYDAFENTIFTLEDPVEYIIKGYIQSEVKERRSSSGENNYTFQEGLVGILRQDPDIIMIGEIRRKEEASICLEAANTGHIVMGSTHANSSIGAITRLKKLGVEPYLLASSLKYIVFQKLIRKICPVCRISKSFERSKIPDKFHQYIENDTINGFVVNDKGCSNCYKGYAGNILISEIIKNDDEIYSLILSEKGDVEFRELLLKKGFIPYYIDAFYKALDGYIDINDVVTLG